MANTHESKEMTSAEVLAATLPPSPEIQVRERQNGTWTVHYPDPGFIPCAPVCTVKQNVRGHKCDYEQAFIETNYKPTDRDDAIAWATYLSDGRQINIVGFVPLAERNKKRAEAA